MKKPTKCITPKKGREQYRLTARDMRNLIALVKEANNILSFYINMPENQTGELETGCCLMLEELSEQIDDLRNTVDNVIWD